MKATKRKIVIVGAGAVIVTIAAIVFSVSSNAANIVANTGDAKPVKVADARLGRLSASEEYAGFVRGVDQSLLATKINGRIVSIAKREGAVVKKGEIVATLSADDLAAQSKSAKQTIDALYENLEKAKKYYDQKVDEAKKGSASNEEVQSAKRLRDLQVQAVKTEIVNAQGTFQVARSNATEAIVRAPFDGVITKVFQEVGQVVGPAVPICEIASQPGLLVEIYAPHDIASNIKKGQIIAASCGEGDEVCSGVVDAIGPSFEANAQKSLVRILFSENNPAVFLGQYVTVRFSASNDSPETIIIPEESVVARYDDKFVFVVDGDMVKERKIVLGKIQNKMAEVVSGISPGEKVIMQGITEVRDNDKVKIYE